MVPELQIQQDALQELHSLNDWIRWMASQMQHADVYFGHGTDNAWDDAAQLALWSLAIPWERLQQFLPVRLTMHERQALLALLNQRIDQRVPVAYITGEAQFFGLNFIVNKHVLIPRSPIAELIEKQFYPWLEVEPAQVLDLCTGSGCIGIACATVFEGAAVTLSDISELAIDVATQNIARHDLQDSVVAIQSDLFAGLTGQCFDLIVCNPPYVGEQEMSELPQEYTNEPELALASGEDGLDFVRRLLSEVSQYLNDGGLLVLEVGNTWETMDDAFETVPFTWLDFENGGHGVTVLNKTQIDAHFSKDNTASDEL